MPPRLPAAGRAATPLERLRAAADDALSAAAQFERERARADRLPGDCRISRARHRRLATANSLTRCIIALHEVLSHLQDRGAAAGGRR